MNRLPSGLADPLHIEPPFPWWALVVLLLILLTVLWVWLRRRRAPTARPPLPPPAPVGKVTLFSAIRDLRERYQKRGSFRRACHELSGLLRVHFEKAGKHPFSTLTSREIGRAVGDTALSRFFSRMSDMQFRRREPSKSDFHGLCEVAEDLARARAGKGAR